MEPAHKARTASRCYCCLVLYVGGCVRKFYILVSCVYESKEVVLQTRWIETPVTYVV